MNRAKKYYIIAFFQKKGIKQQEKLKQRQGSHDDNYYYLHYCCWVYNKRTRKNDITYQIDAIVWHDTHKQSKAEHMVKVYQSVFSVFHVQHPFLASFAFFRKKDKKSTNTSRTAWSLFYIQFFCCMQILTKQMFCLACIYSYNLGRLSHPLSLLFFIFWSTYLLFPVQNFIFPEWAHVITGHVRMMRSASTHYYDVDTIGIF